MSSQDIYSPTQSISNTIDISQLIPFYGGLTGSGIFSTSSINYNAFVGTLFGEDQGEFFPIPVLLSTFGQTFSIIDLAPGAINMGVGFSQIQVDKNRIYLSAHNSDAVLYLGNEYGTQSIFDLNSTYNTVKSGFTSNLGDIMWYTGTHSFILPKTYGSPGFVLTEDGSGNLSWATPSNSSVLNLSRIVPGTYGGDGGTYSLSDTKAGLIINLNPTGNISSFNVILPVNPVNNQVIKVVAQSSNGDHISQLNILVGNQLHAIYNGTVFGLGNSPNFSVSWIFDSIDSIWFRM